MFISTCTSPRALLSTRTSHHVRQVNVQPAGERGSELVQLDREEQYLVFARVCTSASLFLSLSVYFLS